MPLNQNLFVDGRAAIDHAVGAWFREPVREMILFAEHYDFAISLLLDDAALFGAFDEEVSRIPMTE